MKSRKLYKVTYENTGEVKREKYVLSESKEKAISLTISDIPNFSVYKITITVLCDENEIVNLLEGVTIRC